MKEENSQPQHQKPKNGTEQRGSSKRNDEDYESGEDQREDVQDYEEERNDQVGETLLEKMQLQERTLQVNIFEEIKTINKILG